VPQFSIFSVDGFEFVDTILRLARPNRSFELAADAHWYSYIHWYNIGYTEHTMVKKLTKHGNSLALVIDRPVLDILKIDAETPLEISTDGVRLIIVPAQPASRKEAFDAAQEWAHRRYGKAFEKLAK